MSEAISVAAQTFLEECDRPFEGKIRRLGPVGVARWLGEPVPGPRIAVGRDLSVRPPVGLLQPADVLLGGEWILLGEVAQERGARVADEIVVVRAVVRDRGAGPI